MDDGFGRWICEALAQQEHTQSQRAAAIGLSPSAVSRLIKGDRQLKASEMRAMAEYFGTCDLPGFAPVDVTFDGTAANSNDTQSNAAPIYAPFSKDAAWIVTREKLPIDVRRRPEAFATARLVFGLYAPNDAAFPRFKSGEIIWVDPGRPVRSGDDVLFVDRPKSGERAIVGELRERRGNDFFYFPSPRPGYVEFTLEEAAP